jgi:hypothetical protein
MGQIHFPRPTGATPAIFHQGLLFNMTRQVIRKPHSTAAAYKTSAISSSPTQAESILLAHEQHDSPAQLAERWALSPDFIRDLFKREVGVIIINRPEQLHKRAYSTIRIPRSVSHRVHCRLRSK